MGIPGQWKTSMHLYNNVFKYNKLKYRFSLFFLKKNSKRKLVWIKLLMYMLQAKIKFRFKIIKGNETIRKLRINQGCKIFSFDLYHI